jgi:hypothetical protein
MAVLPILNGVLERLALVDSADLSTTARYTPRAESQISAKLEFTDDPADARPALVSQVRYAYHVV